MPRQPVPRRQDQAPLFGNSNTGRSSAKVGFGTTAHFDEDRTCTVAADEINLAAFDTKVARQNLQAVCDKMTCSDFLGGIADLLRGVGDAVEDNCGHE